MIDRPVFIPVSQASVAHSADQPSALDIHNSSTKANSLYYYNLNSLEDQQINHVTTVTHDV